MTINSDTKAQPIVTWLVEYQHEHVDRPFKRIHATKQEALDHVKQLMTTIHDKPGIVLWYKAAMVTTQWFIDTSP